MRPAGEREYEVCDCRRVTISQMTPPRDEADPRHDTGGSIGSLHAQARERGRVGDRRGALRILLDALRSTPLDRTALAAAADLARQLGHAEEERRFRTLANDPEDPQARYELGYLLVDSGVPELGAQYLELCLELVPDHPKVGYELGFARFRCGDDDIADPLLERAFRDDSLADSEVFSAGSLLVQCRVRRGDRRGAREALDRLERLASERDEAEIDALSTALARAERLGAPPNGDRDHLFLLAGSMLLHSPRSGNSKPAAGLVGLDFLAGLLRRLERALTVTEAKPDRIVFHHDSLAPLAIALGRRLNAQPVARDGGAGESALHLLRFPSDATPSLKTLRRSDDGSVVFALAMDPRVDHPLAPDIVGQFAERLVLPWEEHIEIVPDGERRKDSSEPRIVPADSESSDRLGNELADAMMQMEGDGDDLAAVESYYRPLRDLLVVNRPDDHPLRRMITALRPTR